MDAAYKLCLESKHCITPALGKYEPWPPIPSAAFYSYYYFPFYLHPQPFELDDGSIVINVRNQNNYHCRCRVIVSSLDGGLSLPIDELYFDYELIDPVVAAGALQKEGVIYFTNPSNEAHSKWCYFYNHNISDHNNLIQCSFRN